MGERGIEMDNNNNLNSNQQMLQKQEQQIVQIQVEDNTYLEEQKNVDKVKSIDNNEITPEQVQKNNIQMIRNMSKMTEEEQIAFTKKASDEFESSSQLQKERRISGLKKSQRKEISQSLEKKDELKAKNISLIHQKQDTVDDVMLSSYFHVEKNMMRELKKDRKFDNKVKKRVDPTGAERRERASRYHKINIVIPKVMDADIDNLVHNLRYDMYLEKLYEPDSRLEDMREITRQFYPLFKEREREIGRQLTCLSRQKSEENFKWPEDLPVPEISKQEVKQQEDEFALFHQYVKGATTNSGAYYESSRSELRAMEKAMLQLKEDEEFQPSAYTKALIRRLEARIENKKKELEISYRDIRYPAGIDATGDSDKDHERQETARARAKIMVANCKLLSEKASEVKRIKESLDGLQGEELAKEKEKVDASVKKIEDEVRNIMKNFHF